MNGQIAIPITDDSQVGEVRRSAARIAKEAGLDETLCGRASIVATELATNLARHAKSGEVLLRPTNGGAHRGLEILAIDRGPGMASISRCLVDGFSTNGTPGNGLGAVQRLSTSFDIGSSQPAGTVVLAQLSDAKTNAPFRTFNWGVVSRPAPHETLCGDAWRIAEGDNVLVVMMVDGLGHGPEAAKAADTAASAFESDPFAPLVEIAQRIDRSMRGTRGGALALARLEPASNAVRYVGIGNIAARVQSTSETNSRGCVSHNGTAGVQVRKIQEFEYPLSPSSLFIMHSDGLQQRWSLDLYPGWTGHHPAVLAGLLYRDFTRGRDDVTVAVVRIGSSA